MKKDSKRDRAKKMLDRCGYASGGSVTKKDDKKSDKSCKAKPKFKDGGYVDPGAPVKRIDKPTRKATPVQMNRGGVAKKKGSGKTQVNVIVAPSQKEEMPPMMPPPGLPPMAPAPIPPGAGAGLPPGAPPVPGMPPKFKRGGKVNKKESYPIDAGAGSGKGRLQKAESLKKKGVKPA